MATLIFPDLLHVNFLHCCPLPYWRKLRGDPVFDFVVGGLSSALATFAFKQEDAIARHCWQIGVRGHAHVVPFLRIFYVHFIIFIAVRKDENTVSRGQLIDRVLADKQNTLVVNRRPSAASEQQHDKGEWLGLHMLIGVEPLHPVDCRDARVIQTWCVNQIESLHLVADGILRDPYDTPASSK